MAESIKITDAQLTALETAGVFEAPEGDERILVASIRGNRLSVSSSAIAGIICGLSNDADELSQVLSGEPAAWARKDARVLSNLYSRALRATAA